MKKRIIFLFLTIINLISCDIGGKYNYDKTQKHFQDHYNAFKSNYGDGIKETENRESESKILDSLKGKLMINWIGAIKNVKHNNYNDDVLNLDIDYSEHQNINSKYYFIKEKNKSDSTYQLLRNVNPNKTYYYSGFLVPDSRSRDNSYTFILVDVSEAPINYSENFYNSYKESNNLLKGIFDDYKNGKKARNVSSELFKNLNKNEERVLKKYNTSIINEWLNQNLNL